MAPISTPRGTRFFSRARTRGVCALAFAVHLTAAGYAQTERPEPEQNAPSTNPGAGSPEGVAGPDQGAAAPQQTEPTPAERAAEANGTREVGSAPGMPPGGVTTVTVSPAAATSAAQGVQRALVPIGPDPRLRSLDTSFPAEQDEVPEVQAPAAVMAPIEVPSGPRGPARRMLLRTINGVTVLTNVDDPEAETMPASTPDRFEDPAAAQGAQAAPGLAQGGSQPGEMPPSMPELGRRYEPRPTASASSVSPWLWGLGSFAAVLLVPIAVLLTRPLRRG